jgi:transposase
VPDEPGLPAAEELAALPHAVPAERLAEAYRLIAQLTARVEALERRAGRDSFTSSKPPSSDSPFRKKQRDRSLREKGKRPPGKQRGEPGTTMRLVADPDERLYFPPAQCRGCGEGLDGEPVALQRRHQVADVAHGFR